MDHPNAQTSSPSSSSIDRPLIASAVVDELPNHLAASSNEPAMRHDATHCDAGERLALPKLPGESEQPLDRFAATRLTPQQQTAISLLVLGRSAASVAAQLKVHRSTLARWRHQHSLFAAELARQQRDVFETAGRRLRLLMVKAVGIISEDLHSKHNRRSAAWKVLTGLRAAQWAALPAAEVPEKEEWADEESATK